MILIDFTQTIIAGLMAQLKHNDGEINENMLRHMILNSCRNYQRRYGPDYGQIVLCTDAAKPWRRDFFPLYKANRKKTREADDRDWKLIFDTLHKVKMEIKENFPYKYMYVRECEADDIIAVLVKHAPEGEDILIVSGDKDFQQLHKYDNVKQWSPNLNKMIDCPDAKLFLKEHILKGDKSDGVPNILSNDDCFDAGIRQTPLRRPILEKYLRITIENDDKYYRNYLRNQTLIDFEMIPERISDAILSEYQNVEPVRGKVFDYLRTQRLNQLLDNIGDFSL
jgi:5'-3' exonuclease|tara:strand:- start:666 stop:1508 length:843 start_codon:yes stop_codon:yes gene_type:complete